MSGSLFRSSSLGFFPHIILSEASPMWKNEWAMHTECGHQPRLHHIAAGGWTCARKQGSSVWVGGGSGTWRWDLHRPGRSPHWACPSPVSPSPGEQLWWLRKENPLHSFVVTSRFTQSCSFTSLKTKTLPIVAFYNSPFASLNESLLPRYRKLKASGET